MKISLAPRGPKGLAGAVLAGGISAALFAAALMHAETLLVFLAYLAAIPLFVAGLAAGNLAGLLASVTGFAGLAMTQPMHFAITYAFINALPAASLVGLALYERSGQDGKSARSSEGQLLTAIVLYPCLLFLVAVAGAWSEEGGLLGVTIRHVNEMQEILKPRLDPEMLAQLPSLLPVMAKFIPVIIGIFWIFITSVCLVVAQHIVQKQGLNLRPPLSFRKLNTPGWLIFALAATGLMANYAPPPYDYIGLNLSIILGLPYFFVGLAVVHAWAETFKSKYAVLFLFYLIIGIPTPLTLTPVFVGVIDQWANFRQRFSRRNTST